MGEGRLGQAGTTPLSFELLAEIATGPTARVELCRVTARGPHQGRLLAVKRLHPHIAEDPQFYNMFVDEVWMTAALDHPNVARVVGWGTDDEGTYLAVELCEGVSLARLMKTVFETREAFTERMVVYLGSRICAGLGAAHGLRSLEGEPLQLVHRDLTPGNILLGFDGRVLVADFGLAKAKQRVTKTLTGLLKGHPHYMAPEQASDGPIDARADLFSLGVVLFELFTGSHPWSGGNELEVFHVMANQPPLDILSLRPKLDKELATIVHHLLEKDPARRFQNALLVQQRLDYWLEIHGYKDDNAEAVGRFVRRNAMRQQRWFERAIAGEMQVEATRAKSRLLGARARPNPAVAPASRPPPPPRRRAARRAVDESDRGERGPGHGALLPLRDTPSNETQDFSEEIPTVVKPNATLQLAAHHAQLTPRAHEAALPSFADDESDGRTTKIKSQHVGMSPLSPQDTERELPAPSAHASGRAAGRRRFIDEPSEELPTTPVRHKPQLSPQLLALGKLPPPAPLLEDRPTLPRKGALEPPPRSPEDDSWRNLPEEPSTRDDDAPRVGEGEPDLERLTRFAAELAAKADSAARLAAHRSVLAQLAAEAVALAREAAGAEPGSSHALSLMREAYRLESSARQGERQSMGDSSLDLIASPNPGLLPSSGLTRPSAPPPPPTPPMQPRHYSHGPVLAGAAAEDGTERPSFVPNAPLANAPPQPSLRPTQTGGDVRGLLSGEVFGIPVWLALAFAFLVALALVILVDVVRG